ncbi:MAG: hypothetical protein Q4B26_17740 [Eubacteriales bacterium]|nr:hypothetical protein [Eubacteriales bacterium]
MELLWKETFQIRSEGWGHGQSIAETGIGQLNDGKVIVYDLCMGYVSGCKSCDFAPDYFHDHTLENFISDANEQMNWKGNFDTEFRSSDNLRRLFREATAKSEE